LTLVLENECGALLDGKRAAFVFPKLSLPPSSVENAQEGQKNVKGVKIKA